MLIPPLWILTIAWALAAVTIHGTWLLWYPAAWLAVGLILLIVSKLYDATAGSRSATESGTPDP